MVPFWRRRMFHVLADFRKFRAVVSAQPRRSLQQGAGGGRLSSPRHRKVPKSGAVGRGECGRLDRHLPDHRSVGSSGRLLTRCPGKEAALLRRRVTFESKTLLTFKGENNLDIVGIILI